MTDNNSQVGIDLSTDQVRLMLSMQGYIVSDVELVEITASLNALIEGLSHMEKYGALENEPWPILIQFGDLDA